MTSLSCKGCQVTDRMVIFDTTGWTPGYVGLRTLGDEPKNRSRTASLVFSNLPASQSAITRLLNLPALFALADFHLFSVTYAALSCAAMSTFAGYSAPRVHQNFDRQDSRQTTEHLCASALFFL